MSVILLLTSTTASHVVESVDFRGVDAVRDEGHSLGHSVGGEGCCQEGGQVGDGVVAAGVKIREISITIRDYNKGNYNEDAKNKRNIVVWQRC